MLFLLGVEDNSLCNDRKYETFFNKIPYDTSSTHSIFE